MSKQTKDKRKFSPVLLAALIFCLTMMALPVFAQSRVPDLTQRGSISLTFKDGESIVAGGEVSLYEVALAFDEDGDLVYEYGNGFENCGIELGNLEDSKLASKLEAVLPATAEKTTLTIGQDGKAVFTGLAPGLYLIRQTKAADNYAAVSSFLVSLPQKEGESWIYELDASPKMENLSKITPKTEKKTSKTPTVTKAASLPQTGQLNWPIPVLALAGLFLLLLGRELSREKKTHEA